MAQARGLWRRAAGWLAAVLAAMPAAAVLAAMPAAAGAWAGPPAAAGQPARIMSLNLCADQLLLALVPPSRIASVSWLARMPAHSLMPAAAARVPQNRGTAEDVLRQHPDLVVLGSFSTPATRALLARAGYPMLVLDEATSFAAIRRNTRLLAAAVGARARGEALIAQMDAELAAAAQDRLPRPRVAAWDAAGFSAAPGSLLDALITAAGADNIAARLPGSAIGRPDTEALLAAAPALLVMSPPADSPPGLTDTVLHHPLIDRYWPAARRLELAQAWYTCGTPMAVHAVALLHAQWRAAAGRALPPLPFARARLP